MPNPNLNILIEENIPFLRGMLDDCTNVSYLPAEGFTPQIVKNADAILIRTRTHCDSELLNSSRCKLIATATIGTDHIDLAFCAANNIKAVNAPGCNAPAVAQYVLASLLSIHKTLQGLTIGIIGVGHVGSIVENWSHALGMNILRYDPPRQLSEGGVWHTIEQIAEQADIVTFHTPLTKSGEFPTYHIADKAFFSALKRKPIIINSARGAIVDTTALLQAAHNGLVSDIIIDCWENEPDINLELLQCATIATPHIAGYSREGKIRASQAVLDAVCTFFNLPQRTIDPSIPTGAATAVSPQSIRDSYNPIADTKALRTNPDSFETLRNQYKLRNEVPQL